MLFLHGAGQANSERMSYLARFLAQRGMHCVQFDHSGHGESSGTLSASSLSKRRAEAGVFLEMFKPRAIVASSMGGHTALQISASYCLENLVLFAPAIFRDDSDNVQFGDQWSRLIREPNSFKSSNVPHEANLDETNVLHIIGSLDQTIPDDVTQIYRQICERSKSATFMTLIGGLHNLHDWLRERGELREAVCKSIDSFVAR